MKTKLLVGAIMGILFFCAAFLFIRLSNDHKECGQVIEQTRNENGDLVTSRTHHCKERFNF